MKLTVITPIPTPYRDPFWDTLSRHPEIDLTVIYCAATKGDRPWATNKSFHFRHHFPASWNLLGPMGWGSSCYINKGMADLLRQADPDVVFVGGYNHFTMLQAIAFCRRKRIPWMLMSESWKQRGGITGQLKHWTLHYWLQNVRAGLPTGKLASQQLCRLGIPEDRQCLLPNVPDLEAVRRHALEIRENRSAIRTSLGVPPNCRLILFAARMIDKKHPQLVVEAFQDLAHHGENVLVMLGDGPLRREVEQFAYHSGCMGQVFFPGFVEPEQVHRWMAVADVFVQPSFETWGVAPIEALASGTPVILAKTVGCHADILIDPTLGVAIAPGDRKGLCNAIQSTISAAIPANEILQTWNSWFEKNTHTALSERLVKFLRQTL